MHMIKRLTLAVIASLFVGCMMAQTAEKLISKYKAFPDAEYENTLKDQVKSLKKDRTKYTSVGVDVDKIIKNLKSAKKVGVILDEDEKAELKQDLDGLKGYDQIFAYNGDLLEPDSNASSGLLDLDKVFHTKDPGFSNLWLYAKIDKDIVNGFVVKLEFFGKTYLLYVDGKYTIDDWKKMMEVSLIPDDDEEEEDD